MTARFKPTRAGIIGIWDYDHHVLSFADGRLVLRGPNGSGKTKALEVLVPFVLDGSIDPRRLDPFSGKQRDMKSNLLYGGQTTGLGYCWLEFAKGEEVVTIGVGMRAHDPNPRIKRWWFVADGRVGEEVELVEARGGKTYALGKKELVDRLGREQVQDSVEAHQRAVDDRLFGLGHERYRDMLELVLTLRRPQLAKDLNPDQLSDVLSGGLRTVDTELLHDSAEAFEHLDHARRQLAELERARDAVAELLTAWRTWLRARAAERCAEVEKRASRLRATSADIDALQRRIEAKAREAHGAAARARTHRDEVTRLQAASDGLKRSRAYQDQGQLEDARARVQDAAASLRRARKGAERATKHLERAQIGHARSQQRLEAARDALDQVTGQLRGELRALRLGAEGVLDLDGLAATLVARRAAVEAVLEKVEALEEEERRLGEAEAAVQRSLADLEAADERLRKTTEALAATLAVAGRQLASWHSGLLPEMRARVALAPLQVLLPELGAGVSLEEQVRQDLRPLANELTARILSLEADLDRSAAELQKRRDAVEEIRSARQDAPPAPPTRRTEREDRPGAPLWRLVRFRDEVEEPARGGIEGALLAAGLLDAWVDPSEPDLTREDTALHPTAPQPGPTLARVLEPEEQDCVAPERIAGLLDALSLEPAGISARPDGSFQLGPLVGAHRPGQARYIGATARARHRAVRIASLEAECRALEATQRELDAERQGHSRLRRVVGNATEGLPDAAPLRRARRALDQAEGAQAQARKGHEAAVGRRDGLRRQRDQARHALQQAARDHGTPADPAELRALSEAVRRARRALDETTRQEEQVDRERTHTQEAEADLESARKAHEATAAEVEEAEEVYTRSATHLQTLEQTLGAEVKQVLARLDELAERQTRSSALLTEADQERQDAEGARQRFEGEQGSKKRQVPDLESDLDQARAHLRPFQHPDLAEALAVPTGEADFAERLARVVAGAAHTEEQLKTTETRLTRRLEGLDAALGSRFRSSRYHDDGIVRVAFQDELGTHGPAAFCRQVDDRLEIARQLMASHEQKLFEDQLLGNLCAQLRERMDETRTLVGSMDTAMQQRRLASGKSLGIAWRARTESSDERKELLQLLAFEARLLGPARLQRVRELLRDEVQAARRDHPDRSYHQILMEALDYRAWHHFVLTLYEPDGGSARLSTGRHGQLSGGEKAATLHLPLFAAAHAHFGAGRPDCPRLVALDEAFAGIDRTGVPQLLRLAHEFDLDWFLTGYDLWVTEPFLPAVMHYDLAHDPVSRVVSAWPILWNGRETVEGDAVDRGRR